jgi:hypothetical protein
MKVYLLILVLLLVGCSHCSVTKTKFTGKTTGINPYGNGNIVVDRESYWGFNECLSRITDEKSKSSGL